MNIYAISIYNVIVTMYWYWLYNFKDAAKLQELIFLWIY